MSNTKCPRCGLINWSGDELCERCGGPLAGGAAESAPVPPRPDFPALTLGASAPASRAWVLVLAGVFALALCGAGWAFYQRGGVSWAMRKDSAPPGPDQLTRDTLLAYLAQPGFAGDRLAEQVLGPARLELMQVTDREVYFSVPPPDQTGQTFDEIVARFLIDPKRVAVAKDDGGGRLRLGEYALRQSARKHFFFKTPAENVRFDPATVLEFYFPQGVYRLDMRELGDFLANKTIFGGRMRARTGETKGGLPVVFANHGAFVARPGEPSLSRFVAELTRDLPAGGEGARESRVQRVLDFVSQEITYDQREATYDFEMLKKPNEVMMTGQSDCSNKAILLGSLLEQLGEEYLFVYTPDHITVAVRRGGFPAGNGLSLEWAGQTWLVAEATAPGFRIGLDRLRDEGRFKRFQYVQRPRDRDVIFDLATGRQLLFQ